MDELRQLTLRANGVELAKGHRLKLRGRATLSLKPDMWELDIYSPSAADLTALRDASSIAVEGEESSILACGQMEELYSREEEGKNVATAIITDGMDFWSSAVNFALAGGNTVHAAIRTLAARCTSPVPVSAIQARDVTLFRGQSFLGRTADFISSLAKSVDARAFYFHGAIHVMALETANDVLSLQSSDLLYGVSEADGALVARMSAMKGYALGQLVSLPEDANRYRLVCQAVEADNHQGAWKTELIMVDENKILSPEDWSGGI